MRTGSSSGESNIPHFPKASRAAAQGDQETHAHIAGVLDLAELRWQKHIMANEVQNQRRLGAVCEEDGPHSKYDENTRSLQFCLIFLYFGCCFLLFFLPPLLSVCSSSIDQKAPDDNLLRGQREAGLCVWHQPVESPGEGRPGEPLSSRTQMLPCAAERPNIVYILETEKGVPLTQLVRHLSSLSFCSANSRMSFRTEN